VRELGIAVNLADDVMLRDAMCTLYPEDWLLFALSQSNADTLRQREMSNV
jgi:hypothetical protein